MGMSVSGVANSNGYIENSISNAKNVDQGESEFTRQIMKCVAAGGKKVLLFSDALYSSADPRTGESINIYHADSYSKDNPIYKIKGIDAEGNEFEQEIDAKTINPRSCNYNELLVLSLEAGHESDKIRLRAAMVKDKAEASSVFETKNYIAYAQALMEDQKTLGNWTSYWSFDTWIQDLLDYASGTDDLSLLLSLQG